MHDDYDYRFSQNRYSKRGQSLNSRLEAFHPLFGLRWVLILLNEFHPERWRKRVLAGDRNSWREAKERQLRAEELSEQHGYVLVPPFNDELIIAGQGTMGLEILEDLPDVETVLVPVGGGGMLSGISAAIKLGAQHPVKVIGIEPEFAADAQASFRAGHIVNWSPEQVTRTLADGLRTQSLGDITFAHIQRFVDDIVTVSEEEIREAVRRLSVNPKLAAEPSGAVAVAAFLFHRNELPETTRNVAILSGGNIDPALLREIQNEEPMHARSQP